MTYQQIPASFGRSARNQLDVIGESGLPGALAALESFYYSFNNQDLDVFARVWIADDLIRLKNPLGGILDGIDAITALYDGIYNGPADVWVEFSDIVAYLLGDDAVVFSGREKGEFTKGGVSLPLDIRTTRVFHRFDGRWGQVHHHGSITDSAALDTYRAAVNG